MDLQDFAAELLYFDLQTSSAIKHWLQLASEHYADGGAEQYLQLAYAEEPQNLSVLVALYRFQYYQHRHAEALHTAYLAMNVAAESIGFPGHWRQLTLDHLGHGVLQSYTMVRFYLMALKGAGYLNLRLGELAEGVEMLNKVIELDCNDRLGAKVLLRSIGPTEVKTQKTADVIFKQ
jgi:hypothetical protein